MRKLAILAVLALSAGLVLQSSPAYAATTHWVNDNDNSPPMVPPGTSCNDPGYATIQSAVTLAAPGDTIFVCAGNYPENVTVDRALRITGAGVGVTRVTGVSGTPGPIFNVLSAANVTIERLTVDGMSALAGSVVWGIRYDGTNGVIRNLAVLNIRDAGGGAQGLGIRIQNTVGPSNVRVENNLVQNFTRVGINGNFTGVNMLVRNNTVIGPVPPKVWAPNGIQISRGATASVSGNSVRDATSPVPPAGAGSGILLFCAGPTTVEGNRVDTSDLGIAISDNQDGTIRGNVVRDSVFEGYSVQFIGLLFGPLGCPLTPSPTQNNVMRENLAVRSAENGLSLASFDPNFPAPPTMNDFLRNVIRTSGIDGIHVFDGRDNRFIGNSIAISGDHDCDDDTVGTGTAGTANTWHDNDGTTSEPPGLCDDDDRDDDDDDDFDDDGEENGDDDDDDNDGAGDDGDDDDDNDGIGDEEDLNDDNDGLLDAVDDVETFTVESLLTLTIPTVGEAMRVSPD